MKQYGPGNKAGRQGRLARLSARISLTKDETKDQACPPPASSGSDARRPLTTGSTVLSSSRPRSRWSIATGS